MNPQVMAAWSNTEALAGEAGAAAAAQVEEIGVAVEIDRYGDAALEAVIRTCELIRRTDNLPDVWDLALVGLEHAGQAKRYDRLEQAHWHRPILRQAAAIEANGRALIALAEQQLETRVPAGVNGEVAR